MEAVDFSATTESPSSRQQILHTLDQYVKRGETMLVFVVKLDRLKLFNHAHGVATGDQLIATIGNRLVDLAGESADVGSLGSGAFMMLTPPGSGGVLARVGGIVASMSEPVQIAGNEHVPELRIGVSVADAGRATVDQLLIEASAAMRTAADRRSRVVIADDDIRMRANLTAIVERDIESALSNDELRFAYQPVVAVHDGVIHGAEALLRWDHPELGAVDPQLVVDSIDAMGLGDRFTRWSLDRIAREWATVIAPGSGLEGASVSINVCQEQLANPHFVSMVQHAQSTHGLDTQSFVFEVVESGPVGIGDAAADTLRSLASIGGLIVLDDFGTGLNALEYFLEFPVHGIKFDRGLISAMSTSETARVIVRGVARIADELGVLTVAEGIETEADLEASQAIPLTFGQGWHFGYPVPLDEFIDTARRSREGVAAAAIERSTFNEKPEL